MAQPEAPTTGRRRLGVSCPHARAAFLLALVIALGACGRTELDQGAPFIAIGAAAGRSGAVDSGRVPSPPTMDAAATADADAGGTAGAGTGGSAGATIVEAGVDADAALPQNPPSCPATFSTRAPETDCDPTDRSLCEYLEGRCTCEWCSLGAGPASRGTWLCEEWTPAPGCPLVPPAAGTACAAPGLICGEERVCDALSVEDVQCTSGTWQILPPTPNGAASCPGPPTCGATFSCSFGQAPAAPEATSVSATTEQQATDVALARYDAVIGRFLRGDVTVYSGELSATSVSSNSPGTSTKLVGFRDGNILALLDTRPTLAGDWAPPLASVAAGSQTSILVVHDLTSRQSVVFGQLDEAPSTTWAGRIVPDDPTSAIGQNPLSNACAGCLAPLAAAPLSIYFEPFLATSPASTAPDGGAPSPTLLTDVEGEIGVVAPCTLRWPDLVDLNTAIGPGELSADLALASFVDTGTEMVSHESGTLATGPATASGCVPQVGYTLDLWISKADLAMHGVRGFQTSSTTGCTN